MNKIEKQVMAGVAAIYVVRRLTSLRAIKTYALLCSVVGVAAFASLSNVMVNFIHVESKGLPAMFTFLFAAITKTNLGVQAALLVGIVALFSLAVDVARSSPHRTFA